MSSTRDRNPFEESEILGMAERLYRQGLDSEDTELERGQLIIATTDMALAKLMADGADARAAEYYRSEDCRAECMLKACMALARADTGNGRAMVNYMVKAVQNRARTLLDRDVRDSQRLDHDFDMDTLPSRDLT